jgi:hypothetical protein
LRSRRREEAPEMRRRTLLTVVTVLGTMCALSPAPAQARTAKASFEWFVEENVARASNGDQVTVSGEGTFDAGTKSATGDATFEHRTGTGTLVGSGTIEFERLVAFQFYGCGNVFGTPLPDDYCGGRVIFAVHLVGHLASDPSATIEADALFTIECEIGSPPSGSSEGITLNVKDLINFNKHVVGDNLYVME